jgi:ketosteroid isomerase-like protein
MPQENVELVRRHLEAWNRCDRTTWLASFSSDGELDWSRSRGPLRGVYRGHGELERLWEEFWSTFEDVQIEAHGFTEAGSDVVVPNTGHLRGRDGIEVTATSAFVFTIENGQIARLRMFQERAEALEAAGP